MDVQDDLENSIPAVHSSFSPDSSRPTSRDTSSDDDRIVSNEALREKVDEDEAELGGNMFKNIWHEYVFIFIVTSAQLITVSFSFDEVV